MPKSKYEKIYYNLKQKIECGDYPYGELMPSENTLVPVYECSRNTIRRALSELTEDGYVQPIHGKGVRVIYQPVQRTSFTVGGIESFQETARRNQFEPKTDVIQFSLQTVDHDLSVKTGFSEGEQVYYIQRVRYLNGIARILDTNIFIAALVPGLTPEIAEHSIYEYIENQLGMQIVTSKRQVTVERASELDEKYLNLGDYNCLAVVTGQTFNSDGVMFEYTQSHHQPDFFCFQNTAARKRV